MSTNSSKHNQGYVFASYGKEKYLRDAIVAASTIRRYDKERPIAILCPNEHKQIISDWGFESFFEKIIELKEENRSIVGLKHNLHKYMPFERNMYLDSDMIWCRNPDTLWHILEPYPYTITGQESADIFYGAPKGIGVLKDVIFRRRQRTLRRFNLSYLYRVQTGIMYAADYETTKEVERLAGEYLSKQSETHFVSRKLEKGRTLESCEWSLGMAMSKMNLYVHPWFNGLESPQLDYIHGMIKHDEDFNSVSVKYYCNPFIHSLRGIENTRLRNFIIAAFGLLPRSQDHMWVTPYVLHFGWGHQKPYWNAFSERHFSKIKKTN